MYEEDIIGYVVWEPKPWKPMGFLRPCQILLEIAHPLEILSLIKKEEKLLLYT